jgi:hypothetical protein
LRDSLSSGFPMIFLWFSYRSSVDPGQKFRGFFLLIPCQPIALAR